MRGPGACPGADAIPSAWRRRQGPAHPTPDKHQAPASSPLIPLSLQDETPPALRSLVRLSQFIRIQGPSLLPDSVGKMRQDEPSSLPCSLAKIIRDAHMKPGAVLNAR